MRLDSKSEIRLIRFQGAILRKDSEIMEQELVISPDFNSKKIVLDLTRVHHICSSALGVLVSLKRKLKSQNGDVKLVISDDDIKQVFEITMLDKVFQIHDTVEQAMGSF